MVNQKEPRIQTFNSHNDIPDFVVITPLESLVNEKEDIKKELDEAVNVNGLIAGKFELVYDLKNLKHLKSDDISTLFMNRGKYFTTDDGLPVENVSIITNNENLKKTLLQMRIYQVFNIYESPEDYANRKEI